MSVAAGEVFEGREGERVVVYLVRPEHGVFYETLAYRPGGMVSGGVCGPGAEERFLAYFPRRLGRMRFEGAHKLYRKERRRREALEREVRDLRAAAAAEPVAGGRFSWLGWGRSSRRAEA